GRSARAGRGRSAIRPVARCGPGRGPDPACIEHKFVLDCWSGRDDRQTARPNPQSPAIPAVPHQDRGARHGTPASHRRPRRSPAPRLEGDAVRAELTFYPAHAWAYDLAAQVVADRAAGRPTPDVGLSGFFRVRQTPPDDARPCWTIAEIRQVFSVDLVAHPAA